MWKVPGADPMFLLRVYSQQRLTTYHLFPSHLLIGPFFFNWSIFMPKISGLPSLPVIMLEAQPGPLFTGHLALGTVGLDFQEENVVSLAHHLPSSTIPGREAGRRERRRHISPSPSFAGLPTSPTEPRKQA